ncbi:hypothetical protein Tco_0558970 [Tanacetum coccineum]
MSFVTMADELTLESLTKKQFECFIEYYHETYPEDFKSNLENLEEIYKMMNGGVEYPRTQNASPSEIKEPYEPSPRMYSYEQPSCLFNGATSEERCRVFGLYLLQSRQGLERYQEGAAASVFKIRKYPMSSVLMDGIVPISGD